MSAKGPLTSAERGPLAAGAEHGGVSAANGSGVPSAAAEAAVALFLEGPEAAVFAVLCQEAGGLTVRQIQARLSLAPGEAERALERLRHRGLVTKLNTIVPSYLCRRVDSE